MIVTHRYQEGVKSAVIDDDAKYIVHLGSNRTVSCTFLQVEEGPKQDLVHEAPLQEVYALEEGSNKINIVYSSDSESMSSFKPRF